MVLTAENESQRYSWQWGDINRVQYLGSEKVALLPKSLSPCSGFPWTYAHASANGNAGSVADRGLTRLYDNAIRDDPEGPDVENGAYDVFCRMIYPSAADHRCIDDQRSSLRASVFLGLSAETASSDVKGLGLPAMKDRYCLSRAYAPCLRCRSYDSRCKPLEFFVPEQGWGELYAILDIMERRESLSRLHCRVIVNIPAMPWCEPGMDPRDHRLYSVSLRDRKFCGFDETIVSVVKARGSAGAKNATSLRCAGGSKASPCHKRRASLANH